MSIYVLRCLWQQDQRKKVGMIEKWEHYMKKLASAHTLCPNLPRSLLMSASISPHHLAGFYYLLHCCHIGHFAPRASTACIFVHTINHSQC